MWLDLEVGKNDVKGDWEQAIGATEGGSKPKQPTLPTPQVCPRGNSETKVVRWG